nr:CDP-alcohol phosphatidyltransferase family protein [Cohnella zeiphila]
MNLANKITVIRILLIPFPVFLLQPNPYWLAHKIPFFAHLRRSDYACFVA